MEKTVSFTATTIGSKRRKKVVNHCWKFVKLYARPNASNHDTAKTSACADTVMSSRLLRTQAVTAPRIAWPSLFMVRGRSFLTQLLQGYPHRPAEAVHQVDSDRAVGLLRPSQCHLGAALVAGQQGKICLQDHLLRVAGG